MNQRGLRKSDIELACTIATQIARDAYLLTNEDAAREIEKRKREIQQLERMRGLKIVVEGNTMITTHRARPSDQKRTFRKGREYQ